MVSTWQKITDIFQLEINYWLASVFSIQMFIQLNFLPSANIGLASPYIKSIRRACLDVDPLCKILSDFVLCSNNQSQVMIRPCSHERERERVRIFVHWYKAYEI